ncbi:MAG: hypothetical protein U0793_07405 [Gemmataceae bacterium]
MLATHGAILVTYSADASWGPCSWGAPILSPSHPPSSASVASSCLGLLTLFTTTAILAAYVMRCSLHRGWWYLAALAGGFAAAHQGSRRRRPPRAAPLADGSRLEPYRCPLPATSSASSASSLPSTSPGTPPSSYASSEFGWCLFVQHNLQRFVDPFDHEPPRLLSSSRSFSSACSRPRSSSRPPSALPLLVAPRSHPPTLAPLGHLLLSGLWCFLFFSLSGSKLPTYILPAFPPLALALGCYIASGRVAASRWTITVAAAWSALMLVTHWVIVPGVAEARSPIDNETQIEEWCGDPAVPVYSFPRTIDSVAFHLGRSDVRSFRSKDMDKLIAELARHPRSVVLFGHRNSLETMRRSLPLRLRIVEEAPLGLCKMAKVERR